MIHTVLAIFVMGALIVLFVGILMVFKHHPAPPQVPYDGSEGPLWDHDALERKDLLFHKMENVIVVHRVGFPNDDEVVRCGGVGDIVDCPIYPQNIKIIGSNSRLTDLKREFDER